MNSQRLALKRIESGYDLLDEFFFVDIQSTCRVFRLLVTPSVKTLDFQSRNFSTGKV